MPVGRPVVAARVVAVEHRGDGVEAQAVDVELFEPVEGVGDQEIAHAVAAPIVDKRAPVGVVGHARVCVLVERRSVEVRKRVRVGREVGGHPVEDHAQTAPVQVVDQEAQVVGRAVAERRCVVADDLVAPASIVWMLHHGHQFDVGEAVLNRVIGERLSQVAIRRHRLVPRAFPAAQVDFVDAQRTVHARRSLTRAHPVAVAPLELRAVGDDGGQAQRFVALLVGRLHAKGIRVGLVG